MTELINSEPTLFLFPNKEDSKQLVEKAIEVFSNIKIPSTSPIQTIVTKGLDNWQIYNQLALAAKYALDDLPQVDVENEDEEEDSITSFQDEDDETSHQELSDNSEMNNRDDADDEFLGFSGPENLEDVDESSAEDVSGDEAEIMNEEEQQIEQKKDAFGLNDGFFDIDNFNKQTLALEEEAVEEGVLGDEDDDIDLLMDPDENMEDSEDESNGPQADSIMYEDFFGPKTAAGRRELKKKKAESKRKRTSKPDFKNDVQQNVIEENNESSDNEYATFDRVKKDLFASDEEDDVSADQLSSYERDKARLTQQIRELEAENVAKKSWTMMGEATSKGRPSNSLLDVDLEFETGAKPVPVQTEETTETLEDLIKNRIISKAFDDVPKRAPVAVTEFRPSELFELNENKSQRSLAEEYEEEFLKKSNADTYKSEADKKKEKEHEEIKALFSEVSRTLDSLASWHYVPPPPESTVEIVSNAPTLAMEDVQPTAASDTMALAPQEVYKPSNENREGETITRSGIAISSTEMDHQQKQARRRRVRRKHAEKRKQMAEKRRNSGTEQVVRQLSKSNVEVIGKGGERKKVASNSNKYHPIVSSNQLKL